MSAVTEIFGTIIKETGRTAAGSHPLKRATGASASHSRYSCIHMVQLQHAVPDSLTVTTQYIDSAARLYLHHRIFWFCWASKPIDPNKAAAEVRVGKIGIAQGCTLHPRDCEWEQRLGNYKLQRKRNKSVSVWVQKVLSLISNMFYMFKFFKLHIIQKEHI